LLRFSRTPPKTGTADSGPRGLTDLARLPYSSSRSRSPPSRRAPATAVHEPGDCLTRPGHGSLSLSCSLALLVSWSLALSISISLHSRHSRSRPRGPFLLTSSAAPDALTRSWARDPGNSVPRRATASAPRVLAASSQRSSTSLAELPQSALRSNSATRGAASHCACAVRAGDSGRLGPPRKPRTPSAAAREGEAQRPAEGARERGSEGARERVAGARGSGLGARGWGRRQGRGGSERDLRGRGGQAGAGCARRGGRRRRGCTGAGALPGREGGGGASWLRAVRAAGGWTLRRLEVASEEARREGQEGRAHRVGDGERSRKGTGGTALTIAAQPEFETGNRRRWAPIEARHNPPLTLFVQPPPRAIRTAISLALSHARARH
jgi:hypothetical protein